MNAEELTQINRIASRVRVDFKGQLKLGGEPVVDFGVAKFIVQMVLDHFPKTRDSDLELIDFCKAVYAKAEITTNSNYYETWRRTRQKLQEQGFYEASPEVQEARKKKQEWMKENVKYL